MKPTVINQIKKWVSGVLVAAMGLMQTLPAFAADAAPIDQNQTGIQSPVLTIEKANIQKPDAPQEIPAINSPDDEVLSPATPEEKPADAQIAETEPRMDSLSIKVIRTALEKTPEEVTKGISLALNMEAGKFETRTYEEFAPVCQASMCRQHFYSVDVTVPSGDDTIEAKHYVAWVETGGEIWGSDTFTRRPADVKLLTTPERISVEAVQAAADSIGKSVKDIDSLVVDSIAIPKCFAAPCPVFISNVSLKTSNQDLYEGTISKYQRDDRNFEYKVDLQIKETAETRQVKELLTKDLVNNYGLYEGSVKGWIASGDIRFDFGKGFNSVTVSFSDKVTANLIPAGRAYLADLLGSGRLPSSIKYTLGTGPIPMIACPLGGPCPVYTPNHFIVSGTFDLGAWRYYLRYYKYEPGMFYATVDGVPAAPVNLMSGDNRLHGVTAVIPRPDCTPGNICLAYMPSQEPVKTVEYTYKDDGSIGAVVTYPGLSRLGGIEKWEVEINGPRKADLSAAPAGYIREIREYRDGSVAAVSRFVYDYAQTMVFCMKAPCNTEPLVFLRSIQRTDESGAELSNTIITGTGTAAVKIGEENTDVKFSDLMDLLAQIRDIEAKFTPEVRQIRTTVINDLVANYGLDETDVRDWLSKGLIRLEIDKAFTKATLRFLGAALNAVAPAGKAVLADLLGDGKLPESIEYALVRGPIPMMLCIVDGPCPRFHPNYSLLSATFSKPGKLFRLTYYPVYKGDIKVRPLFTDNRLYHVEVVTHSESCNLENCAAMAELPLKTIDFHYGDGKITATIRSGLDPADGSRQADISAGYVQEVRDYDAKDALLAVSRFVYVYAVTNNICIAGAKCPPSRIYAFLNSIARTAADGKSTLSETQITGQGAATVKIGENKTDVKFETVLELLDRIRTLENSVIREQILAQMNFGSRGRVIVKAITENGKTVYKAFVQVMADYVTRVYPNKTVYNDLAEFILSSKDAFQVIFGSGSSWYKQEGIRIFTLDGKTVTFWNISSSYSGGKSYRSAYYTVEDKVFSALYNESLKRQSTYNLLDNAGTAPKILLGSSNYIRSSVYTWKDASGREQSYEYLTTVQSSYWSYDEKGDIASETMTRRTEDGSSATVTKTYGAGDKMPQISIFIMKKGQVALRRTLKDVRTSNQEFSGLFLGLEGTLEGVEGTPSTLRVTFRKDTLEYEFTGNTGILIGNVLTVAPAPSLLKSSLTASPVPAMVMPLTVRATGGMQTAK